jgi:16S rRNA processing protein RimM
MKSSDEKLHIATIGKCVGLRGDLKLHLFTDFPEQFQPGNSFTTDKNQKLTILTYEPKKSMIQFVGFGDRETAAKLTNQKLFATMDQTRKLCKLKEGEYFWFDLTGAEVVEEGSVLGRVNAIERIAQTDYLLIDTAKELVEEGLPKRFYIPYIPRYVEAFDSDAKTVFVKDAHDILEAS